MKAKAASKSTNWNLRVIASRSLANCQSGSRFNACFSSSIANFAMITSQRIFLLDAVDAAVAGQLAGIETESVNRKFVAGEEGVGNQPFAHLVQLRVFQPRQGDVRHELVRVLRLADLADGIVHLALQMFQQVILAGRGPQRMRLSVAELADAIQL